MRNEIGVRANDRGCWSVPARTPRMRCGLPAMVRRALAPVGAVCLCGCASVAQLTNLAQPACAVEFREGIGAILVQQGETSDAGEALAAGTLSTLATGALGPRPFLVASSSGTDYEFFIEKKPDRCLLRLYGRRHGFVSYTNNLTYIATRPLPRCECAE